MPRDFTDSVQVNCLDGTDPAWDRFVEGRPEATFFHLSAWKAVIEESFGHKCHYLVARQAGEIVGILPLTHVRGRLFGNSLLSNAFGVYGGPLVATPAALAALDDAALTLAQDLRAERIEYRLREPQHPDWPTNRTTYVTFRKAIEPDPARAMAAIPRKQRAMVRKGIKEGLVGEIDTDVSRFYPLYAESLRNLGTPVLGRRYFECLKTIFRDASEVVTITLGGRPLASVLSFFFRDEVLPYYGGGCKAARNHAANDFMYWVVMSRACEARLGVFDFGRSKVGTGSYAFKKHWGFDPRPLHYEHRLLRLNDVPDITPLNPRYGLMIAAWRRLPLVVANTIGPYIAQELA
ncbi:FemAB family XrtA/PEP-CTERM system-associated protein [Pelagibius marinus]|uniref:FemAB family XrtA/PEP-CTERM system-associated protein n=1 Tax=Pelagibius marinus TaxID=2762760 RepID=UPI001872EDAC|nr:FemAB family XrtA/PEP-CTERM system-associated protein [Pelagibius marinus]